MNTLRLEWRTPSELADNPANWRTHPPEQLDALTGIISEVGWTGACLFNELTGRLIDGHARKQQPAANLVNGKVPVLVGSWTEEQEAKILASFDPIGALATADAVKLDALLSSISAGNAGLAALLESLARANPIIAPLPEPGSGGDEFDTTPADGPTLCQPGDVWVIGGKHRLLVGDCTDAANVARLMDGQQISLVTTDPPYGVAVSSVYRKDGRTHGDGGHAEIAADETNAAATEVLDGAMAACLQFVNDNAGWYIWHAHSLSVELFGLFVKHLGKPPRALIVWRKSHFVIGRNHYHQQHEPCLYGWKGTNQPMFNGERNQSTVWDVVGGGGHKHENHPTEKPLELFSRPIANHLGDGEIVYDPFLGSGTTLIAAHRLGRTCYGCEIECRYADVVLKRCAAEGLSVEKAG